MTPTKKSKRKPNFNLPGGPVSSNLKVHGRRVSQEIYESMWEAWKRGDRIKSHLQETFGLTSQTVSRIVDKGYPERGWLSLRERWRHYENEQMRGQQKAIAEKAMESLDAWEAAKQQNLRLLRAGKAGVAKMVQGWFESMGKIRWVKERRYKDHTGAWQTTEVALTASEVARIGLMLSQTTENFLKQESLWLGGPTEAVNVNSGTPGWFSLSPEQLDQILESGQLPPGVTDEMLFGAANVKLLAQTGERVPPAPANVP